MSKPTEGPWEARGKVVFDPRTHRDIAWCDADDAPFSKDEGAHEANARLIAAAPDMYEALKELDDLLKILEADNQLVEDARSIIRRGLTGLEI